MSNNYFQFKQFTIQQEKCSMKVGTDGVLLGAWANIAEASRILDIGTGTGLIALIAAQRNQGAMIDAIDADINATIQAQENFINSPWNNRLKVYHQELKGFESKKKYEHIICNPPFFHESQKPENFGRTLARHSISLNPELLFERSYELSSPEGLLSVIYPFEQKENIIRIASDYSWHVVRMLYVFPSQGKKAKRVLLEFSKNKGEEIQEELIIEENVRHQYTLDYKNLTKDFYLNF